MGEITAGLPGIIFILVVDAAAAAVWLYWLGTKERSFPRFRSPRWFYPYFVLGVLSGFAALFIELSPLSTAYDSFTGFAGVLGYEVLFVGLIEEGAKFGAFLLVTRFRDQLREPFDAALGGATVGLGFAVMENVVYGLYRDPALSLFRSFITIQGHMFYSTLPAIGFALAILLHGLGNTILTYSAGPSLALMMDPAILCLLAVLVSKTGDASPYRSYPWREWRAALAAITKGLDADPENPNLLFRRGLYNLAGGRWVDACVAFDGVVETGRRRDLATSFYAVALYACGEKEESSLLFGQHWPNLSPREKRVFSGALMRAMPSRAILRAEIRDMTRKSEWLPRRPDPRGFAKKND